MFDVGMKRFCEMLVARKFAMLVGGMCLYSQGLFRKDRLGWKWVL